MFLSAFALAPALALAVAAPAEAHGGHCGGPRKPPCSILRPPEAQGLGTEGGAALGPECIVLVGGFDSTEGDDTFDDLFRWTGDEPGYALYRFGTYEAARYPYDTTGRIDTSAEDLTNMVRSLRGACRAIDVVTHSMGGAVADRAFAKGLSARDRVTTYVALSGPHNGATLAKALRPPIDAHPLVAAEISALARAIDQPDPTTAAADDLARKEAPHRMVRDVASLRLHVATDVFVLRRDNADRRVDRREHFAGELEGHGGILHDDEVRRVVATTLLTHMPAADTRSALQRGVAERLSGAVDALAASLYGATSDYLLHGASAPLVLAELWGAARIGGIVAEALGDIRRATR